MRLYVDTSVYLNVVLAEAGHLALSAKLRGATLCTSSLLFLEARRNIVRLVRQDSLTARVGEQLLERIASDVEHFQVRDLTLELCLETGFPALSIPKTLDLAHLATALWFHRRMPLHGFMTLDRSQRTAARELGLPG